MKFCFEIEEKRKDKETKAKQNKTKQNKTKSDSMRNILNKYYLLNLGEWTQNNKDSWIKWKATPVDIVLLKDHPSRGSRKLTTTKSDGTPNYFRWQHENNMKITWEQHETSKNSTTYEKTVSRVNSWVSLLQRRMTLKEIDCINPRNSIADSRDSVES